MTRKYINQTVTNDDLQIIFDEYMRMAKEYNITRNAELIKLLMGNDKIVGIVGKYLAKNVDPRWASKDIISKYINKIKNSDYSYDLSLEVLLFIRGLEYKEVGLAKTPDKNRHKLKYSLQEVYDKFREVKYVRKVNTIQEMYEWFLCRKDVRDTDYAKVSCAAFGRALHKYKFIEPVTITKKLRIKQCLMNNKESFHKEAEGYVLYHHEVKYLKEISDIDEPIEKINRKDLEACGIYIKVFQEYVISGYDPIFRLYDKLQDLDVLGEVFKHCNEYFDGKLKVGMIASIVYRNYCRVTDKEANKVGKFGDLCRRKSFRTMLETEYGVK